MLTGTVEERGRMTVDVMAETLLCSSESTVIA